VQKRHNEGANKTGNYLVFPGGLLKFLVEFKGSTSKTERLTC